MYNLFEDEDDVFTGSPRSKFADIVFNANSNLVLDELDVLVKRAAILEMMLEEKLGDDLDKIVKSYAYSHPEEAEKMAKSAYIELVGNILSKNE
ncbi:MAG: DUF2018 family protein [Campylobacterota bacterium]|nr:DUF2018 family protein [Campylobacterota bacterium]